MPRFSLPQPASTRFASSVRCLGLGICLASSALLPMPFARADEFSALPPGDPIATQLALISPPVSAVAGAARPSLTRYEAALQTARVILDVQNRDAGTVSRAQWRAIAALCTSLKNELRQLGVDVDAARALSAKNLQSADILAAPKGGVTLPKSALLAPKSGAAKPTSARTAAFLSPALVANSSRGTDGDPTLAPDALQLQLLPHVRVATDLQRVTARGASSLDDSARFNSARFGPRAAENLTPSDTVASQTALSYDLSHYLTLRAANSRLDWNAAAFGSGENPLLGAPLFAGARGASGTSGGVDLSLGGLKFSTEVERLRADTGTLASRIGGGASLSAFQNRLSMQMSLSRLTPGQRGALSATAAQASASLDVTPRLSLNLRYQGLFAPTPSTSASRVAGGVSLSF